MAERSVQHVYVLGLGALGALLAGKLHDYDPSVLTIIADSGRQKTLSDSGVTINGTKYKFRFKSPDEGKLDADLVLIAVKNAQLPQAIKDIKKFVGKQTTVISLLNGISSEEEIAKEIGMEHLLYSYGVGMDAVRNGSQVSYTNSGSIVFGEKDNRVLSGRVMVIKELFDKSFIPNQIPENMIRALWAKFLINTGINQASAVLNSTYGIFQKQGPAKNLMLMAAREVLALSAPAGIHLNKQDVEDFIGILNTLDPEGKTSMLQDVQAGRKSELELFAGTVIELGLKYQIPTPVNATLFEIISAMEQKNGLIS